MTTRQQFWIGFVLSSGFFAFSAWQNSVFHWTSLAFLVLSGFIVLFAYTNKNQWDGMQSAIGHQEHAYDGERAVKEHIEATKVFVAQTRAALNDVNMIGQPEFEGLMKGIRDESIRTPLLLANRKIMELRDKERENNWVTHGVAAIAELKHKSDSLSQYCYAAISEIVKYLKANQGGLFLLRTDAAEPYFELTAAHAYGKKKYLENKISVGEGMIGQVYYEKEIIYMTDVPADYIKITSGLGEALPRCVCIVPLLCEGQILGAFEIASFNKLLPHEIAYLKKIAEGIANNLNAIETSTKTEKLLFDSRKMSQELKEQEEGLRQNMEELTATQEQMRSKQFEMDSLLSSLSVIELDLDGKIMDANAIFLGATGYRLPDLVGKHYNLISQNNDTSQFEIMWSSILTGRIFSGEFKVANSDKKEIWMAGNFTPILNESGKPYKVTVITVFTTRDKEKQLELQDMVAAFKACLPVAEINDDLSFRSANDLFLSELGIRRLDLKKSSVESVFKNGSFGKVKSYLTGALDNPNTTLLDIVHKDGSTKVFNSTLFKWNHNGSLRRRGLVILRNTV
jgi:PAS domain S-box-containing protein